MQEDARRRAEEAIAKQWKWHHKIEVAPGVWTPGLQDTQTLLSQIGMPEDLSGMRVLDIGARDGFFTFEAERRGAREVVALDNEAPTNTGFAIAAELLDSRRPTSPRTSIRWTRSATGASTSCCSSV